MLEYDHKREIVVYSCILYVGVVANIAVLISLRKIWRQGSRGQVFFLHLTIANLLALFLFLGTRIAWSATVVWLAGNVVCKIVMFMTSLGMALVNYTVAAFSVDNAVGILTKSDGKTRRHILQVLAWIITITVCSPQLYVYNVQRCPFHPEYEQCVPFNAYHSLTAQDAYNWWMLVGLYLLPVTTIIVANGIAVLMWARNTSPPLADKPSASTIISDRRTWTLELFITIGLGCVVFVCWTPISVLRIVSSAQRFVSVTRSVEFVLDAVSLMTYCLTPAVYGIYWAILRSQKESTHGLEPKPTARD